jgi:hypothetical protein
MIQLHRRSLFGVCARVLLTFTLLVASACGRNRPGTPPQVNGMGQLTGLWDARFQNTVPLPGRSDTTRAIDGQIALLPNGWIRGTSGEVGAPTHYGTYNFDLREFGFDPRLPGRVPAATARFYGADSVWLVLEPAREDGRIVLRGRVDGDQVSGVWDYYFRGGGGAGGRFLLRRTIR